MKIEGNHTFGASRADVWPIMLDPEVLARVMPGCEKLEQTGDNEYEGILKIRVGPVQGKFNGTVKLAELDPPQGFSLVVDGKGAPGFVKGSGQLALEDNGEGCLMRYEGDVQVGGRLASVGQRLLDSSSRAIIQQSLEGLDQQIEARLHPAPDAPAGAMPPPVAAPSQLDFATGVARNMLEDWLPAEDRERLTGQLLLLAAAGLILYAFSNWWTNRIARRVARLLREERSGAQN